MNTVSARDGAPVLPNGSKKWPRVQLSDVIADAQAGFATGQRDPDGVLQLRMQNVNDSGLLDFSRPIRVPATRECVEKYRLQSGDVVFNNTNSAELVGKSAFVSTLTEPLLFSNHFTRLRTRPELLDPRFLAHWLLAQWRRGVYEQLCDRWVGQAAVCRRRLLELTMPLPPLAEQKRIAAALHEHLDAATRMRAAAEQQEACVRELTSIVVNRAFEAPAVEWPLRPIGEMARILSGYAFKSAWFSEHGVRLLRNANVSQGSIDWTDTVFLPEDRRSDFGEYELSAGDIVLALDRPMVADGLKVARLAKGDVPSLLLQRVATFRLSDALDAGYLYAFLRTRAFAGAISGHEQSLGVPHVSPKQVSAVVLPVPPIARQRDIVRTLDDALCSVSSASAAVGDQAAESRRLPESLLRRAFSPTVDPAKNVDPSHVDGGSRVGPHPG